MHIAQKKIYNAIYAIRYCFATKFCNDFLGSYVAPVAYIGDGNSDIEDFCGEPITVRSPDHDDPGIVAGFHPLSGTKRLCSLRDYLVNVLVFMVYPVG